MRLGLDPASTVKLTRNRVTVASYRNDVYRIHQAFLDAPADVLRALATFSSGRTRRERAESRKTILAYPIVRDPVQPSRRSVERTHPDDEPYVARLHAAHARLNAEHFYNALRVVQVRVSRRMKKRLGHYVVATGDGLPPEIAISRRHLRRDAWGEVLHTLLHEMVHQWQDEQGAPGRPRCGVPPEGAGGRHLAVGRLAAGRHTLYILLVRSMADTSKKIDELYTLIDGIGTAMLTTRRSDGHLVSRACGDAAPERIAEADLWFVTDVEIAQGRRSQDCDPNVNLRVLPGPDCGSGSR